MTERRLFEEIADAIRNLIREGTFPPGARLPGERELSERFEVSRVTIREARRYRLGRRNQRDRPRIPHDHRQRVQQCGDHPHNR